MSDKTWHLYVGGLTYHINLYEFGQHDQDCTAHIFGPMNKNVMTFPRVQHEIAATTHMEILLDCVRWANTTSPDKDISVMIPKGTFASK